jgi:hypothetical protein
MSSFTALTPASGLRVRDQIYCFEPTYQVILEVLNLVRSLRTNRTFKSRLSVVTERVLRELPEALQSKSDILIKFNCKS